MKLMFPVSERFLSLQGEGANVGAPEYFIRLSGCNLAEHFGGCSFCDTRYAQRREQGELLDLETILSGIPRDYPGRACISGGEPLYHEGIIDLLNGIVEQTGCFVSVQTNGSLPIPKYSPPGECQGKAVHWGVSFAMDVKCPGSKMEEHNLFENISRLQQNDQLKFVLVDRQDYDYAKEVLKKYSCRGSIFFQPAYQILEPKQLAEWILQDKLPVRLSLQQQKILWGIRRGV